MNLPAIEILTQHQINYQIHTYQHEAGQLHFGLEAAQNLPADAACIYKTLIVKLNNNDKTLIVAVIPVKNKLSLKQIAKITHSKKADIAEPQLAQKSSGYIVGGISPLGQKRILPTFIDTGAQQHKTIFISGGRRGMDIELSPLDLCHLLNARFSDITG